MHERETLELVNIRAGNKVPQLVRQRFHWGNVFGQRMFDAISVGTKQMISMRNTYARKIYKLPCLIQNERKQQQQQQAAAAAKAAVAVGGPMMIFLAGDGRWSSSASAKL
jgi:hypothetical protein